MRRERIGIGNDCNRPRDVRWITELLCRRQRLLLEAEHHSKESEPESPAARIRR